MRKRECARGGAGITRKMADAVAMRDKKMVARLPSSHHVFPRTGFGSIPMCRLPFA